MVLEDLPTKDQINMGGDALLAKALCHCWLPRVRLQAGEGTVAELIGKVVSPFQNPTSEFHAQALLVLSASKLIKERISST